MKIPFIALCSVILATSINCPAEVTIEECVLKSVENYPAIRKYDLLHSIENLDLSEINKGWLPKINVYGQVTAQNAVPSYPDALSDVLEKMGQEVKGLGKAQYKAGVDISQTIWDGGISKARRNIANKGNQVQQNAFDVELYQVRRKVEDIYFTILLIDKEIEQSRNSLGIINDNLTKLKAMYRNGVAMQSDIDMVEAQALTLSQKIVQAETTSETYRKLLEIFVGKSLENEVLTLPSAEMPIDQSPERPEMKLFDSKMAFNDANQKLSDSSMNPHIGFFSQLYYGYPGFNYFQSMMQRKPSFNIIGGLRFTWDLDSFYTKNSRLERTALNRDIQLMA